ncbi:MAG TPA: hypothetical protein VJZ71_00605 [Phycisphaerae bacterium]|nr:hypothetical protein [Phycisphaerae bacterium]
MSARFARTSIAVAVAALVLGFAGTSSARADHRDRWDGRSFQVQSRHWRNGDFRGSRFRDDCRDRMRDCGDWSRSCRPRRCDTRYDYGFNYGRRDFGRSGCR